MNIRAATSEDMPRAVATLAAAFATDPLLSYFVRKDSKRPIALQDFFQLMLAEQIAEGVFVDIAEEGAAVAVWYAPGRHVATEGLGAQLRLAPRFLRITGWRRLLRGLQVGGLMDKIHPKEPCYYLQFLGCHPESQGRGLGSALLKHRLAIIDAESASAYLETAQPNNLPLYLRHGFAPDPEVRLGRDGPIIWPMQRKSELRS